MMSMQGLLAQMGGGQGQMDQMYMSTPGYYANYMNYQQGGGMIGMLTGMIKKMLFPYAREQAPHTMSQFDFDMIQRQSNERRFASMKYSQVNPYSAAAIGGLLSQFGVQDPLSMLVSSTGEATSLGKITSDLFNKTIGGSLGIHPYLGEFQAIVKDTMKGTIIDRASLGRTALGMSNAQSDAVLRDLMLGTYADEGFTRKRGIFSGQDTMEVFRMAKDYGVFRGAGMGQFAEKTQDFAKVIQKGMQLFQTTDKEEALQNILNITGGTIALSDTGKLESAIDKIKAMARTSNVSINLLSEIISRGQDVAEQVGISRGAGTAITMNVIESLKATPRMGKMIGGVNIGAISENTIAAAGGERAVQQSFSDLTTLIAGSNYGKQLGALIGTRKTLGLDYSAQMATLTSGRPIDSSITNAMREEIVSDLVKSGKYSPEKASGLVNLYMGQRSQVGIDEILNKNPDVFENAFTNEVLKSMKNVQGFLGDEEYKAIQQRGFAGVDPKKVDQFKNNFLAFSAQILKANYKQDDSKARAQSEIFLSRFVNADEIKRNKEEIEKKKAQDRIEENFKEGLRKDESMMSRAMSAMSAGSDLSGIISSAFPQAYDESKMQGVITSGEVSDFVSKTLSPYLVAGPAGSTTYKAASMIYGKGGLDISAARSLLGMDINKMGAADKDKLALAKTKLDMDIRLGTIDLEKISKATGLVPTAENMPKLMSIMKQLKPEKFSSLVSIMEDFKATGIDLSKSFNIPDTRDIASLNKIPWIEKLAQGLGKKEGFASISEFITQATQEGMGDSAILLAGTNEQRKEIMSRTTSEMKKAIDQYTTFQQHEERRAIKETKAHAYLASAGLIKSIESKDAITTDEKTIRAAIGKLKPEDRDRFAKDIAIYGLPAAIAEHLGAKSTSEIVDIGKTLKSDKELQSLLTKYTAGEDVERMTLKDEKQERLISGMSFTKEQREKLLLLKKEERTKDKISEIFKESSDITKIAGEDSVVTRIISKAQQEKKSEVMSKIQDALFAKSPELGAINHTLQSIFSFLKTSFPDLKVWLK